MLRLGYVVESLDCTLSDFHTAARMNPMRDETLRDFMMDDLTEYNEEDNK